MSALKLLRDEASKFRSGSSGFVVHKEEDSDGDESVWDDGVVEGSEIRRNEDRKVLEGAHDMLDAGLSLLQNKTGAEGLQDRLKELFESMWKSQEVSMDRVEGILAHVLDSGKQKNADVEELREYLNKVTKGLYNHSILGSMLSEVRNSGANEVDDVEKVEIRDQSGLSSRNEVDPSQEVTIRLFPTKQNVVEERFRQRAGRPGSSIVAPVCLEAAQSNPGGVTLRKESSFGEKSNASSVHESVDQGNIEEKGLGMDVKLVTNPDQDDNLVREEEAMNSVSGLKTNASDLDHVETRSVETHSCKTVRVEKLDKSIDCLEVDSTPGGRDSGHNRNIVDVVTLAASAATAAVASAMSRMNQTVEQESEVDGRSMRVAAIRKTQCASRPAQIVHTPCLPASRDYDSHRSSVERLFPQVSQAEIAVQTVEIESEKDSAISKDSIEIENGGLAGGVGGKGGGKEYAVPGAASNPGVEAGGGVENDPQPKGVKGVSKRCERLGVDLPEGLKTSILRAMEDINALKRNEDPTEILRLNLPDDDSLQAKRAVMNTLGGEFDYGAMRSQLNAFCDVSGHLSLGAKEDVRGRVGLQTIPEQMDWNEAKSWRHAEEHERRIQNEVMYRVSRPWKKVQVDDKGKRAQGGKSSMQMRLPPGGEAPKREESKVEEVRRVGEGGGSGITMSQRLRRKRGPPDFSQTASRVRGLSHNAPQWLVQTQASKKPRQPPKVAFGRRVDPRVEPPVVAQKGLRREQSKPVAVVNPPLMERSVSGKGGKTLEKQWDCDEERIVRSVAESSAGDTDELLVDGLVEILMKAAQISESSEEREFDGCGRKEEVLEDVTPSGERHGNHEPGDNAMAETQHILELPQDQRFQEQFLSVSDILEPPVRENKMEIMEKVSVRGETSVGKDVEDWLLEETLARAAESTVTRAKFGSKVIPPHHDPSPDSPVLAAHTEEQINSCIQDALDVENEEKPIQQEVQDEACENGLDSSILKVLVDALVDTHIADEILNNPNNNSDLATSRSSMSKISVPVMPDSCSNIVRSQDSVSEDACHGMTVLSKTQSQPCMETDEVSKSQIAPLEACRVDQEGLGSIHDGLRNENSEHEGAMDENMCYTGVHSPCPRTPLTIRPQTACTSSQTLSPLCTQTGVIALTEVAQTSTSDGMWVPNTTAPLEGVASVVGHLGCTESFESQQSLKSRLHGGSSASMTDIATTRKSLEGRVVPCLMPSLGHAILDTTGSPSPKEEASGGNESKLEEPVDEAEASGSRLPPSLFARDSVGEDGGLGSNQKTATRPTQFPPVPPPGLPCSLKDYAGSTKWLWRPEVESSTQPIEGSTPSPAMSEIYGPTDDSSSTTSWARDDDRRDATGAMDTGRLRIMRGFRLNHYRARRRFFLEQAGVTDSLLITSASSDDFSSTCGSVSTSNRPMDGNLAQMSHHNDSQESDSGSSLLPTEVQVRR